MNHILYRSQNADAMSESELSRLEYERELEEDNLDPITGNIKPIFIDLDYVISITFCCQLEQEALEIKTSMAHRLSFELITHRLAYHGVVTFIDSDLFYFILRYVIFHAIGVQIFTEKQRLKNFSMSDPKGYNISLGRFDLNRIELKEEDKVRSKCDWSRYLFALHFDSSYGDCLD